MEYRITAACSSNRGKVRKKNEDNYYFNGMYLPEQNEGTDSVITGTAALEANPVYAVFDGVGGGNYGEKAAFLAASSYDNYKRLFHFAETAESLLTGICLKLNDAVVEAQKELDTPWMAATVVAALFTGNQVVIGNLGDSKAYRVREGEMKLLSVMDAEESTFITATGRKRKGALTQYLGMDPEIAAIRPNVSAFPLQAGDSYLLCSDGLTDLVSDERICEIICSGSNAARTVELLSEEALAEGGRDNITVIVVQVDEKAAVQKNEQPAEHAAPLMENERRGEELPDTKPNLAAAQKRTPLKTVVRPRTVQNNNRVQENHFPAGEKGPDNTSELPESRSTKTVQQAAETVLVAADSQETGSQERIAAKREKGNAIGATVERWAVPAIAAVCALTLVLQNGVRQRK